MARLAEGQRRGWGGTGPRERERGRLRGQGELCAREAGVEGCWVSVSVGVVDRPATRIQEREHRKREREREAGLWGEDKQRQQKTRALDLSFAWLGLDQVT